MTNVAEKAPTGSVEWYAKLLRRIRPDNRANVAMAVVQVIAADEYVPEQSKVRRIVAVAEAVDLLEREHIAELRAAVKLGTAAEGMPDPQPSRAAAGLAALAGEVRAAKAEERDHDGSGVECVRCKAEGFEGVHHDAQAETGAEASPPPARFWPGWDVVRKGGMPAGFPSSLRVTRVIPIDGSGINTPQRRQFQAAGRNEWFHCDEYERVV